VEHIEGDAAGWEGGGGGVERVGGRASDSNECSQARVCGLLGGIIVKETKKKETRQARIRRLLGGIIVWRVFGEFSFGHVRYTPLDAREVRSV